MAYFFKNNSKSLINKGFFYKKRFKSKGWVSDKSYRDRRCPMKTELKCPHCQSQEKRKRGSMKTKRGKTQIYECKSCNKRFTKRTGTINYRKRKQHLRDQITNRYCEKQSLRGLARTMNASYPTIVKYFRENAELARLKNEKRLGKGLVTSYVQFDQLETYEHTKKKPVGIQISVRPKTNEIISAKVGYIPIRALTVSKQHSKQWNVKASKSQHTLAMILETKKALNKNGSTITCDKETSQVNLLKDFCHEDFITLAPSSAENKKIDRIFRRIRNDVSRLNRRTICTTKDITQLQNHLDLYTEYHNVKRTA